MKKQVIVVGTLLLGGMYNTSVNAAPTVINCPTNQVRVEMTTGLPQGWWRTPYVNNLKSTAISRVGNQDALICKYGNHAAFWTMHRKPPGMNCRTSSRGFVCNRPPQPPRTHKTGPLVIPQTYLADLDTGIVGSQGADIWFQAQTATARFITPRNGAKIGVAGTRSIGLRGCERLTLTNRSIPLSAVPAGTYVCAKTDQGRYSQFKVTRAIGSSPGILHIGFTTWKR